jgi:hypothetical protein
MTDATLISALGGVAFPTPARAGILSVFAAASLCLLIAGCEKPVGRSESDTPKTVKSAMTATTDPLLLQARRLFQPVLLIPLALPGRAVDSTHIGRQPRKRGWDTDAVSNSSRWKRDPCAES